MRIKLGDKYWLNGDRYCFWITEEYTVKKGKNAGSTDERACTGYTPTFEQCVESFIEKGLGGAEIDDLKELVKTVTDLKEEVRSWRVDLERK